MSAGDFLWILVPSLLWVAIFCFGTGYLTAKSELSRAHEVPAGFVLVPREPTNAMLKAACASMSPGKRPTTDWVSVKEKHRIRYQAMIEAASNSGAGT